MAKEKEPHEKHRFKLGKKGIIGLLLGLIVVALILVALLILLPSSAKTQEVDVQNVDVLPESLNASKTTDMAFTLDIPTQNLENLTKDNLDLSGFFEGMEITDVKTKNDKLTVGINGDTALTNIYDENMVNGYIYVDTNAVKQKNTAYAAEISVVYPKLESHVKTLEIGNSTDISMTLTGDKFTKTPSANDIVLDGMLKNMQISNIILNENDLSFHVEGDYDTSKTSACVSISSNVFASGLSLMKYYSVSEKPVLFVNAPITFEKPFNDTVQLNILNDFFSEDISPEMIELGEGLKDVEIAGVEYVDNKTINVKLCADEISETGIGTISLSGKALQSCRTVKAVISIEEPSFPLSGHGELLATPEARDYPLTLCASSDDFSSTMTKSDIVLKGTLAPMELSDFEVVSGNIIKFTISGALKTGEGSIAIDAAAMGGIAGAECSVTVTDSSSIIGSVNLADNLPGMTVSAYDKDGNALDIPTAVSNDDGYFVIDVVSTMPVYEIAYFKAKDENMELSAPFDWSYKDDFAINAFTTLMMDSIASSQTEDEGINKVYSYLELTDKGYSETNLHLFGNNIIFSHTLFEEQANGNVNRYIEEIEAEINAGQTRSFAQEDELSGETGGVVGTVVGWGLKPATNFIKNKAYDNIKSGKSYGPVDALIKPSEIHAIMLLIDEVDQLKKQVLNMDTEFKAEFQAAKVDIKKALIKEPITNLRKLLNITIGSNNFNTIEAELKTYESKYGTSAETIYANELPVFDKLFKAGGAVEAADIPKQIMLINEILSPDFGEGEYSKATDSLINQYYSALLNALPFEHNAATDLRTYVQSILELEASCMQVYATYCIYNGYDNVVYQNQLKNMISVYDTTINRINNLLPSDNVFNIKKQNSVNSDEVNTTVVRLNSSGKYYTFYEQRYKAGDNINVQKSPSGRHTIFLVNYGNLPIASYTKAIPRKDYGTIKCYIDKKAMGALFAKRGKLTPKAFLQKYTGLSNLPDWLISNFRDEDYYYLTNGKITFYDMSDQIYRTYAGDEIYNRFSSWTFMAATVS